MEDRQLLKELNVNEVKSNPFNPRKDFDEEGIIELAQSIKANGLLQPPIVAWQNNEYYIVAGERRHRALKKAGIKKQDFIVRKYSNHSQWMKDSFIENEIRKNISDMEFWDYCTHIYSLMKGKDLKRGTLSKIIFSPDELKELPKEVTKFVFDTTDVRDAHSFYNRILRARKLFGNEELIDLANKVRKNKIDKGIANKIVEAYEDAKEDYGVEEAQKLKQNLIELTEGFADTTKGRKEIEKTIVRHNDRQELILQTDKKLEWWDSNFSSYWKERSFSFECLNAAGRLQEVERFLNEIIETKLISKARNKSQPTYNHIIEKINLLDERVKQVKDTWKEVKNQYGGK
jgi:ParB/RepB/Spo0J family partition protein|tara:strand:+ start:2891 stop:3925 length:1035 start_codon:yes stop_codon:yes gene_type:complete